jgi:hypothetical protein
VPEATPCRAANDELGRLLTDLGRTRGRAPVPKPPPDPSPPPPMPGTYDTAARPGGLDRAVLAVGAVAVVVAAALTFAIWRTRG